MEPTWLIKAWLPKEKETIFVQPSQDFCEQSSYFLVR